MIRVPSRRWLVLAAALAALAPLAIRWPAVAGLLLAVDLLWIVALVVDMLLAPPARILDVSREAPAAFSLGRVLPVRYRWRQRGSRPLTILVREELPDPLGGANSSERMLRLPPSEEVEEVLQVSPVRRGIGKGGTLHVRLAGPLGLSWRQG